MSGVSFRYSEAGVRKVRRVQFGILGPEELKASSVCNIVTDRTFENGKPIPGRLMDPALGAIDLGLSVFLIDARVEINRMSGGRTIGSFVVVFRRAVNGRASPLPGSHTFTRACVCG
jgi:hypothetical protein